MTARSLPWLAALLMTASAAAHTVLEVDASAPVPAPREGHLKMGAAVAPNGERIGINNQYLTRAGKPWMPVMGEFHYSRTPAHQWDAELRKMKAAGIDIVASYIMWNHHEERQGRFDWNGQRDLRRFVRTARAAGLDVMVRVGPWVHAEVRYGGIPDWVVQAMPTRRDDPEYLGHVERLYGQIARQLRGLLWKEGGPVIGVQIENEYNLAGPGEGAGHIATLKRMAKQAGLDVPLYTVTGWDGAQYPRGEVVPVFGSYVDEPWARSTTELAPPESYIFRFDSRVGGDLGAQTKAHGRGTADTDIATTPFIGAEYGAGLPFMYRRRPVASSDDIAAMLPVQLGSGVNLLGYYMFHGGRNPVGATTLEESTHIGAWNDTPVINYDFQAPLGPDGQQRAVLARLRPYHLFMRDFGERLAPMAVRRPALLPANKADLNTPRYAVRSHGEAAFLFVNNHVRQYPTPAHDALQFKVQLPAGAVTVPRQAVTIPSGAYFMWPVNFDLDGTRLVYATAQPMVRLDAGAEGIVYVFGASAGMPVELAFAKDTNLTVHAAGARMERHGLLAVLSGITPGTAKVLSIARSGSRRVSVLVLSADQAGELSTGQLAGRRRLVLSSEQHWFDGQGLQLRSVGQTRFGVGVYPHLPRAPKASAPLRTSGDGIFQRFSTSLPARELRAEVSQVRAARAVPPIAIGGVAGAALQPAPETFRNAAAWRIDVPQGDADAIMELDFVGDIGRLFNGTRLLDDWYYSGYPWQFSLQGVGKGPLTLSVLPLRADAPIYLPREGRPDFKGQAQIAELRGVRLKPVYRLSLTP